MFTLKMLFWFEENHNDVQDTNILSFLEEPLGTGFLWEMGETFK